MECPARAARACLFGVLLVIAGGGARADDRTAAQQAQERATARALFEEGLAFVAAKDWRGAEDRFRRVLALRASHVAAYNLASALEHLDRPVEAAKLLRGVLGASDAPEDTRAAAEQLLAHVEPRVGTLVVSVTGDTAGCTWTLDGDAHGVDAFGAALRVDPGAHEVIIKRGDAALTSRTVHVGGAQPLRVETSIALPERSRAATATLVPAPAPSRSRPTGAPDPRTAPSPRDTGDDDAITGKWWFWSGLGAVVTGAAVVIAVVAAAPGDARPVAGDTDPPVVRGTVAGAMP